MPLIADAKRGLCRVFRAKHFARRARSRMMDSRFVFHASPVYSEIEFMPLPASARETPRLSVFVKRGILYGAAIGMLAGLAYEAIIGAEPAHPIIIWRNFILAGAFLGLVVGLAVGLVLRRGSESNIEDRE